MILVLVYHRGWNICRQSKFKPKLIVTRSKRLLERQDSLVEICVGIERSILLVLISSFFTILFLPGNSFSSSYSQNKLFGVDHLFRPYIDFTLNYVIGIVIGPLCLYEDVSFLKFWSGINRDALTLEVFAIISCYLCRILGNTQINFHNKKRNF